MKTSTSTSTSTPRAVKCTAPGDNYGTTFEVDGVRRSTADPADCWYDVTDDEGEPLTLHASECEPTGR